MTGKARNTILYFFHEANNLTLGRVKLAKLMFFVDLEVYKKTKDTLTGLDYLRMQMGPMPAGFDKLFDSLLKTHLIRRAPKKQIHYQPTKPYDLSSFSNTERKILSKVAKEYLSSTTDDMVLRSHENYAWKHLEPRCYVPFELASVESEEEVKELIKIARSFTDTDLIDHTPELRNSLRKVKRGRSRGELRQINSIFD